MNSPAEVIHTPSRRLVDRILSADAIALLAVVALWLITRPYRGVRHDAILYMGQVFDRMMPERFHSDLFFAFGSQDKYSLFSPLMAPLFAHFGIATAELAGMVVCQVLFVFACWKLTEGWMSRPMRWLALMAVAVLPHTYGGLGAFSFAEPFLTARSLAEPFALLALWQLTHGRIGRGLLWAVASVAFHPLIALPVLLVGWVWLVLRDLRWLWMLALVAVAALAGLAGVAPFDGLWHRFDPEWFAPVRFHNANAFLAAYGRLDLAPALFDVLALLLLWRQGPATPFGRLAAASLVAAAVFTVVWGVGVDLLHNVLLAQIQLWRIYWPMHLLALIALPVLGVHFWERGWIGKWCLAALMLAGIATMSNWATGWVCLLWALAALVVDHRRPPISTGTAIGAIVASFATMVAITWKVAANTIYVVQSAPDRFDDANLPLVVLGLPLVGTLLALLLAWLLNGGRRLRIAALLVALGGLAFGTAMWDQRSGWERRIEASLSEPPAFGDVLPPTASVYWDNDVVTPWTIGRRANFFSEYQASGLMFNRGTAIEFQRRAPALASVEIQKELCETINALTVAPGGVPANCRMSREVALEICHAAVHPDYLVVGDPLPEPDRWMSEWHYALQGPRETNKSFYLYACSALN